MAVFIGTALSYGWALSVLPDSVEPGFEYLAIALTGLIIAGAVSGVFSWLKQMFPWFENLASTVQDT